MTLSAVLPDVLNWSEKCCRFGFGLSVRYILMDVSCSSYYLSLKLRVGLEEKNFGSPPQPPGTPSNCFSQNELHGC